MGILDLFRKPSLVYKEEKSIESLIKGKVPDEALDYCTNLWKTFPFNFKLSRNRKTILGNYTYRNRTHFITVNNGLNPYSFLITFIHEVAHQHVQLQQKRVSPHGEVWKKKFKELMSPLMNKNIFPEEILEVLKIHMKNPKASSSADPKLVKVLKKYNNNQEQEEYTLNDLSVGQTFVFRNNTYLYLEKRRTRCLVKNLKNKRNYTIPLIAEIRPIYNEN